MTANTAMVLLALRAGTATITGSSGIVCTGGCSSQMRDVLRNRVLRTDISDPDIRSFTGFAQCIVARIEVFSFLKERKGLERDSSTRA